MIENDCFCFVLWPKIVSCLGGIKHSLSTKRCTWIIGHSFVKWANTFAEQQIYGCALGLPSKGHEVLWKGKGGMRWEGLFPMLSEMSLSRGFPDLLIIHLDENDLVPLSGLSLLKRMKLDLAVIKNNWSSTSVVWTEFVFRRYWRGARNHASVEKAHRKLYRAMKVFCQGMGLTILSHANITGKEGHLFREDGVHLSQLGQSYYLLEIRDFLANFWNEELWCGKSRG